MLATAETPLFDELAPSTTVLNGDCREALKSVAESSIQCCVTSPPYWGLRDYEHEAQIGSEDSPVEYIENLVEVFQEVRRVLRDDGLVWLNLGDGYARNGGTGKHGPNAIVGNTRKMIQRRNCKVPPVWGLKPLDLMGLPWRVAFALQEDGWFLRSHITWVKTAPMPESVKNRPTRSTEDIFLLSASPKYFYNSNGVRQDSGANLRNCWVIGPDGNSAGHPAAFPRELARRCILLGSRIGDTVLDPFGGCGTAGVVAKSLSRDSVLVEISKKWSDVIESQVNGS
ncbi:MAG: site-specific DNA-methyltransferase [Rhodospirillales bacterium]|nr:site-specific DNA-methyltransferase [Rhodospirillales bacterium]